MVPPSSLGCRYPFRSHTIAVAVLRVSWWGVVGNHSSASGTWGWCICIPRPSSDASGSGPRQGMKGGDLSSRVCGGSANRDSSVNLIFGVYERGEGTSGNHVTR